eukprot:6643648-Pyramimonas_sp.AAC.1
MDTVPPPDPSHNQEVEEVSQALTSRSPCTGGGNLRKAKTCVTAFVCLLEFCVSMLNTFFGSREAPQGIVHGLPGNL